MLRSLLSSLLLKTAAIGKTAALAGKSFAIAATIHSLSSGHAGEAPAPSWTWSTPLEAGSSSTLTQGIGEVRADSQQFNALVSSQGAHMGEGAVSAPEPLLDTLQRSLTPFSHFNTLTSLGALTTVPLSFSTTEPFSGSHPVSRVSIPGPLGVPQAMTFVPVQTTPVPVSSNGQTTAVASTITPRLGVSSVSKAEEFKNMAIAYTGFLGGLAVHSEPQTAVILPNPAFQILEKEGALTTKIPVVPVPSPYQDTKTVSMPLSSKLLLRRVLEDAEEEGVVPLAPALEERILEEEQRVIPEAAQEEGVVPLAPALEEHILEEEQQRVPEIVQEEDVIPLVRALEERVLEENPQRGAEAVEEDGVVPFINALAERVLEEEQQVIPEAAQEENVIPLVHALAERALEEEQQGIPEAAQEEGVIPLVHALAERALEEEQQVIPEAAQEEGVIPLVRAFEEHVLEENPQRGAEAVEEDGVVPFIHALAERVLEEEQQGIPEAQEENVIPLVHALAERVREEEEQRLIPEAAQEEGVIPLVRALEEHVLEEEEQRLIPEADQEEDVIPLVHALAERVREEEEQRVIPEAQGEERLPIAQAIEEEERGIPVAYDLEPQAVPPANRLFMALNLVPFPAPLPQFHPQGALEAPFAILMNTIVRSVMGLYGEALRAPLGVPPEEGARNVLDVFAHLMRNVLRPDPLSPLMRGLAERALPENQGAPLEDSSGGLEERHDASSQRQEEGEDRESEEGGETFRSKFSFQEDEVREDEGAELVDPESDEGEWDRISFSDFDADSQQTESLKEGEGSKLSSDLQVPVGTPPSPLETTQKEIRSSEEAGEEVEEVPLPDVISESDESEEMLVSPPSHVSSPVHQPDGLWNSWGARERQDSISDPDKEATGRVLMRNVLRPDPLSPLMRGLAERALPENQGAPLEDSSGGLEERHDASSQRQEEGEDRESEEGGETFRSKFSFQEDEVREDEGAELVDPESDEGEWDRISFSDFDADSQQTESLKEGEGSKLSSDLQVPVGTPPSPLETTQKEIRSSEEAGEEVEEVPLPDVISESDESEEMLVSPPSHVSSPVHQPDGLWNSWGARERQDSISDPDKEATGRVLMRNVLRPDPLSPLMRGLAERALPENQGAPLEDSSGGLEERHDASSQRQEEGEDRESEEGGETFRSKFSFQEDEVREDEGAELVDPESDEGEWDRISFSDFDADSQQTESLKEGEGSKLSSDLQVPVGTPPSPLETTQKEIRSSEEAGEEVEEVPLPDVISESDESEEMLVSPPSHVSSPVHQPDGLWNSWGARERQDSISDPDKEATGRVLMRNVLRPDPLSPLMRGLAERALPENQGAPLEDSSGGLEERHDASSQRQEEGEDRESEEGGETFRSKFSFQEDEVREDEGAELVDPESDEGEWDRISFSDFDADSQQTESLKEGEGSKLSSDLQVPVGTPPSPLETTQKEIRSSEEAGEEVEEVPLPDVISESDESEEMLVSPPSHVSSPVHQPDGLWNSWGARERQDSISDPDKEATGRVLMRNVLRPDPLSPLMRGLAERALPENQGAPLEDSSGGLEERHDASSQRQEEGEDRESEEGGETFRSKFSFQEDEVREDEGAELVDPESDEGEWDRISFSDFDADSQQTESLKEGEGSKLSSDLQVPVGTPPSPLETTQKEIRSSEEAGEEVEEVPLPDVISESDESEEMLVSPPSHVSSPVHQPDGLWNSWGARERQDSISDPDKEATGRVLMRNVLRPDPLSPLMRGLAERALPENQGAPLEDSSGGLEERHDASSQRQEEGEDRESEEGGETFRSKFSFQEDEVREDEGAELVDPESDEGEWDRISFSDFDADSQQTESLKEGEGSKLSSDLQVPVGTPPSPLETTQKEIRSSEEAGEEVEEVPLPDVISESDESEEMLVSPPSHVSSPVHQPDGLWNSWGARERQDSISDPDKEATGRVEDSQQGIIERAAEEGVIIPSDSGEEREKSGGDAEEDAPVIVAKTLEEELLGDEEEGDLVRGEKDEPGASAEDKSLEEVSDGEDDVDIIERAAEEGVIIPSDSGEEREKSGGEVEEDAPVIVAKALEEELLGDEEEGDLVRGEKGEPGASAEDKSLEEVSDGEEDVDIVERAAEEGVVVPPKAVEEEEKPAGGAEEDDPVVVAKASEEEALRDEADQDIVEVEKDGSVASLEGKSSEELSADEDDVDIVGRAVEEGVVVPPKAVEEEEKPAGGAEEDDPVVVVKASEEEALRDEPDQDIVEVEKDGSVASLEGKSSEELSADEDYIDIVDRAAKEGIVVPLESVGEREEIPHDDGEDLVGSYAGSIASLTPQGSPVRAPQSPVQGLAGMRVPVIAGDEEEFVYVLNRMNQKGVDAVEDPESKSAGFVDQGWEEVESVDRPPLSATDSDSDSESGSGSDSDSDEDSSLRSSVDDKELAELVRDGFLTASLFESGVRGSEGAGNGMGGILESSIFSLPPGSPVFVPKSPIPELAGVRTPVIPGGEEEEGFVEVAAVDYASQHRLEQDAQVGDETSKSTKRANEQEAIVSSLLPLAVAAVMEDAVLPPASASALKAEGTSEDEEGFEDISSSEFSSPVQARNGDNPDDLEQDLRVSAALRQSPVEEDPEMVLIAPPGAPQGAKEEDEESVLSSFSSSPRSIDLDKQDEEDSRRPAQSAASHENKQDPVQAPAAASSRGWWLSSWNPFSSKGEDDSAKQLPPRRNLASGGDADDWEKV